MFLRVVHPGTGCSSSSSRDGLRISEAIALSGTTWSSTVSART